jgi:hypothetical protein
MEVYGETLRIPLFLNICLKNGGQPYVLAALYALTCMFRDVTFFIGIENSTT